MTRRTDRLNSLLKEVISDVIRKDVNHPKVSEFLTVTSVDITKDLHFAKVFVSVIGSKEQKKDTVSALESASGFIAVLASKQVVLRHFPSLTFKLDDSVDAHLKIDTILKDIRDEEGSRQNISDSD
ncbi:ribosome-binding factor A [Candidatus Aerophobetes bacterium]|uniref:Ribosome-binding factor A n=1 Tax=Aerophobetes bacterium TaxID=2030807 RepID=A0A2A4YI17_UNCAE|nr:MAG: ribosome-binding factor A [Candidatus Aerophobetes bacterium]